MTSETGEIAAMITGFSRKRRRYNIKPKSKLVWIDDGHTITVMPITRDPIKALKGRFKDIVLLKALLKSRKEERKHG